MYLLAPELAQEMTLSKSRNSLVLERIAWGPRKQVLVADDLFWIFSLTIIVVMKKEKCLSYN